MCPIDTAGEQHVLELLPSFPVLPLAVNPVNPSRPQQAMVPTPPSGVGQQVPMPMPTTLARQSVSRRSARCGRDLYRSFYFQCSDSSAAMRSGSCRRPCFQCALSRCVLTTVQKYPVGHASPPSNPAASASSSKTCALQPLDQYERGRHG